MILLIDNYDSFTYNVVHYFEILGCEVVVKRNDEITLAEIKALDPSHIVISPGPCTPNEAGISLAVIAEFSDKIPLLGICLGHQSIVQHFGGKIVRAERVMHGKTSMLAHTGKDLFVDCPLPLQVMRYHSLLVEPASLPEVFDVTAWTEDANGQMAEIMAVRHRTRPVWGVQFHPESILSQDGLHVLQNFLQITSACFGLKNH